MAHSFANQTVVITGGTGSLGKVLVRRLLGFDRGVPRKIIIFSRDEAKQYFLRTEYQHKREQDPELFRNFEKLVEFRIGDVRDFHSVCSVLKNAEVVINAAALKQVPSCEYFPFEAVQTNIIGAENIARAIREFNYPVQAVVGVSTDKACKPVNVMGMSKAIQERVFISANLSIPATRFIVVRYGNVFASRGSVIPLFHEQIAAGGPVTVTTDQMTRFLLTLDRAVDTIFAALDTAQPGETYVPILPAARMMDLAKALIGKRDIPIVLAGIRPGEKVHEVMVSEEEALRAYPRGEHFAIKSMLPELQNNIGTDKEPYGKEYSSSDTLLSLSEVEQLLTEKGLMVGMRMKMEGEFLL